MLWKLAVLHLSLPPAERARGASKKGLRCGSVMRVHSRLGNLPPSWQAAQRLSTIFDDLTQVVFG